LSVAAPAASRLTRAKPRTLLRPPLQAKLRRRDAVLAQEARRRGVFRVKARDFRFPGAADD
jgi:hypothetical protein